MLALALSFAGCKDEVCGEGFEGDDCDTEVRAKYLGTWSGPNMCTENEFIPIDISTVTLMITPSDTDILDITLQLILDADFTEIDVPSETTMLIGNAFETGPTDVDFIIPVNISSDGIFRSETELSLDFEVNLQIEGIGTQTISCSADLVKQ